MRLSPLSGLGAGLSAWTLLTAFWPAALLLLAALFLGRYFCGWVCPLGTTLDLWDRLRGRNQNGDSREETKADDHDQFRGLKSRRTKYYLLVTCLFAAIFGLSLFAYLDPLCIAVRTYVLVVHQYAVEVLLGVLGALEGSPVVGGVAAGAADFVSSALVVPSDLSFKLHALTALVFAGLLGLSLLGRRFWCRSLCPLGALYALAGKRSLTTRKVDDSCIHCGRCRDICPMDCISADETQTLAGECILCMQCQAACPVDAIRFLGPAREQTVEIDLTRRGALAAAGTAVVAYPLMKITLTQTVAKGGAFIRPPLAGRDPEHFLQACVRCGQCMRVCPTQVIQPAGWERGLESLWTPELVPRLGYCQYNCNECGKACPTGAIPRFTLEDKHSTAVGLAHLDNTRCIPWRGWRRAGEENVDWDDHNCGVCEEVCPVPGKAIHFIHNTMPNGQELRRPYVQSEACVGCGFCEHACPVQGEAAIRVSGGFREIGPPATEPEKATIAELLPEKAGGMRLAEPKRTYRSGDDLFQWINGAAEPYLKYQFTAAAAALYAADGNKLELEIWQFETTDDAFGAFSKYRPPDAVTVEAGDEAAFAEGPALWAWAGRYFLRVRNMGGRPGRAQTLALARTAIESAGEPQAERPAVCRHLPPKGLDPHSVRFLRHSLHLQEIIPIDEVVEVFGLDGKPVAAYGAYGKGPGAMPIGLLLAQYPTGSAARTVRDAYTNLRRAGGEEIGGEPDARVFRLGENDHTAVAHRGKQVAVSLNGPDPQRAIGLAQKALRGGDR
jgi:MauM/NapG family ferredoxin protein